MYEKRMMSPVHLNVGSADNDLIPFHDAKNEWHMHEPKMKRRISNGGNFIGKREKHYNDRYQPYFDRNSDNCHFSDRIN